MNSLRIPDESAEWALVMPWARFDDHFHSNPKVIAAGNAAAGLYARAITYSADYLTDGFIPFAWADAAVGRRDKANLLALITEAGLWEPVEGGFRIPDYLEYNPSREDVLRQREVESERKRRQRGVTSGSRPGGTPNGGGPDVINPVPVPVKRKTE